MVSVSHTSLFLLTGRGLGPASCVWVGVCASVCVCVCVCVIENEKEMEKKGKREQEISERARKSERKITRK